LRCAATTVVIPSERNTPYHHAIAGLVHAGDFLWFHDLVCFRRVMEVVYFGSLLVTQHLLPLLIRTRGSRVINISSVAGAHAFPGNSAYSAAKFALEAWSDSLRVEVALL